MEERSFRLLPKKSYWYLYNLDPTSLFVDKTGNLLAGFGSEDDHHIRSLDVLTGIDSESTGQTTITLVGLQLTITDFLNRKDSYTLKFADGYRCNREVTVNIYEDEATTTTLVRKGYCWADGIQKLLLMFLSSHRSCREDLSVRNH